MPSSATMSMEEYLATSFRPDREYLNGLVVEKSVGTFAHARTLALLSFFLCKDEDRWGVMGALKWRTRVAPTRIRVPDLVLVLAGPQPPVLEAAPLLVVEILSPDDTYADTQRRAQDYLGMGVHTVWIIDPETRSARQCVDDVWTGTTRLTVPGTEIAVDLLELFAALDASLAR